MCKILCEKYLSLNFSLYTRKKKNFLLTSIVSKDEINSNLLDDILEK